MRARLRWIWSRLDANYWFYPAMFVVLAAALGITGTALDRAGWGEQLAENFHFLAATPQSAQTMLSIIASSMIGVAATVFSITIAAVAFASGTYGPRLMTNFLEDRGNQLSLATLIGTFVYALTVLASVRGSGEEPVSSGAASLAEGSNGFVPQLSLLGAYALSALAVGVIVYLLNHIPSSIRINHVLEDIGRRLVFDIRERYPRAAAGEEPDPAAPGDPLVATRTGYVQMIEFDGLAKWARDEGYRLALKVRTGDFVHPGMALALVAAEQQADDAARKLEEHMSFGAVRTPKQDPQFLIDELVEIGLRALSPGINDPFTAITALHWLGAATAELGQRNLVKQVGVVDDERYVWPLPDDFAHFLARGFGAIRSAVAASPIAARVMLETLANAREAIPDAARCGQLSEEAGRLMEQARLLLAGPDLAIVTERHAALFPPPRS